MPSAPSTGEVTSPYGPRKGSEIGPGVGPFHFGEDTRGDGNYSPDDGQIVFAGYAGSFGNAILIRNGNVVWNIAHHRNLNGRRFGQGVREKEFLAPIGATGLAFGIHAHTERRVGGDNSIQSGAHTNPRSYYSTPATADSKPFVAPEPEAKKEHDMTKIIGNEEGAQKFIDEFGADDIGKYFFVPNGPEGNPSWVDNIKAAWLFAGEPENGRKGTWDMDLARHIADSRWAEKRGQIVADTVNALRPFLAELGAAIAGINPERFEQLIHDGLKNVVVEVEPLSEEDMAAIAETTAQATRDKLRTDPLSLS